MTVKDRSGWLASATADDLLSLLGPGEMLDERQAELVGLVRDRVPRLDLDAHPCSWAQTDDGRPSLVVDGGAVVFVAAGEDLHMVGATPDGQVRCYVVAPDGRMTLGAVRPDPTSPAAAAQN